MVAWLGSKKHFGLINTNMDIYYLWSLIFWEMVGNALFMKGENSSLVKTMLGAV